MDAERFDTLVATHHREIYRYLARTTFRTSEADDLAQETFLRAYRAHRTRMRVPGCSPSRPTSRRTTSAPSHAAAGPTPRCGRPGTRPTVRDPRGRRCST